MSKNVEALKELGAKIIGGETTAADVKGNTIAEVLHFIAENYPQTKTGE